MWYLEIAGKISRVLVLQVVRGDIDLSTLEDPALDDDELLKKLIALPGIGPFSAANMLQLLGRYEKIACDSETVRHFRDHHKKSACNSSNVEATAVKVCALENAVLDFKQKSLGVHHLQVES